MENLLLQLNNLKCVNYDLMDNYKEVLINLDFMKNDLFYYLSKLKNFIEEIYDKKMDYMIDNEELFKISKNILDNIKLDYTIIIDFQSNYLMFEKMDYILKLVPNYDRKYCLILNPINNISLAFYSKLDSCYNKNKKYSLATIRKYYKKYTCMIFCWKCFKNNKVRRYNTINNDKYRFEKMFLCKDCDKLDNIQLCCWYCGDSNNVFPTERIFNNSNIHICKRCNDNSPRSPGGIQFIDYEFYFFDTPTPEVCPDYH